MVGGVAGVGIALAVAMACSSRPLAERPNCKSGGTCPAGWACGPDDECVFVGSGGFGGSGFGGSGFGGGGGGFGGSGFGGSAAVGGSSGAGSLLGSACDFDYECGSGLGCMRADSGIIDGASPPKGLCTVGCSSDTSCQAHAPGARCVTLTSTAAYCLQGCDFGPQGPTQFNPNKCRGRMEMACAPVGTDRACVPRCNADTDCQAGWFCHPTDGLCRQEPAVGLGVGEPCAAVDGGDPCRGSCSDVGAGDAGTLSICAEGCTLGTASCGWVDAQAPAPAFCLLGAAGVSPAGVGDLGSCAKLCDCDGHCPAPLGCVAFESPQVEAFTQRAGYCADQSPTIGACD